MMGLLSLILLTAGSQSHVKLLDSSERAIVKSVTVAAPPSAVWRAWTTPEGIKEFLGIKANIELKFGGRYELLFDNAPPVGAQGSEGCQVLSFVPEKMLSFSWNAPPSLPAMRNQRTFVVVTLSGAGGKTNLELRHAGWGSGADWDKAFAYFDQAWGFVLNALKTRFESGPTKDQNPEPARPAVADLAPLEKMATMIGGTWRGEVKSPDGPLAVEFTYKRHPDGKGIVGEGVIGKGAKHPLWVHSQFGWDPVSKAVYYFDTHDSETLYFGHISLEKDDMIFTFSRVGMLPQTFQSRGRLVDKDTYQAIIKDEKGAELVGFTLKRGA
jgi:uncharacterized protein YndB with AHSA1/START domain